jgi:hypothetical protein|tara:strand:- start:403 stop:729 length:327 start_codon:yes stop_codon:yes gene_type:complete
VKKFKLAKRKKKIIKKEVKKPEPIFYGSNEYGFDEKTGQQIYRDRIYMNLNKDIRLIQKNGLEYKGSIFKKSVVSSYGLCHVYVTADERWFCNAGLPINKPDNLLTHK